MNPQALTTMCQMRGALSDTFSTLFQATPTFFNTFQLFFKQCSKNKIQVSFGPVTNSMIAPSTKTYWWEFLWPLASSNPEKRCLGVNILILFSNYWTTPCHWPVGSSWVLPTWKLVPKIVPSGKYTLKFISNRKKIHQTLILAGKRNQNLKLNRHPRGLLSWEPIEFEISSHKKGRLESFIMRVIQYYRRYITLR